MTRSAFEQAYIERTEREEKERIAKARSEGCPPGFEEQWRTSGKFRMMVARQKESTE